MFEPYEINHGIDDLRFYIGNCQGRDWYDPLKPCALLEYQWVRDNIDIAGKGVADCGAHHGNYTAVFYDAQMVFAIEPVSDNVKILLKNIELNNLPAMVIQGHVMERNLPHLAPDVEIIKMDIEGDEFKALPYAVEQMPQVTDWILEFHPRKGDPNAIIDLFIENGFEVVEVCRDPLEVRPYKSHTWKSHGTVIARKHKEVSRKVLP